MHIRPVGADDVDLLCRMRLAFMAEHRGLDPEALAASLGGRTRAYLGRRHAAGTARSWLAEADWRCVGVVTLLHVDLPPRPDDDRSLGDARIGAGLDGVPLERRHCAHGRLAYRLGSLEGFVVNLYVVPDHRSHGVGRALFAALLDGATADGIRRVGLRATDDGRPLYEDMGFAPSPNWMERTLSGGPGSTPAAPPTGA